MVALGESVHTTRGYSQAKLRIFRYLVEKHGFRVFAFETPRQAARTAGRYVARCEGSSEAALASLLDIWASESVLELLRWMCSWNRRHPDDPLAFIGFDIQEPWAHYQKLRTYFAEQTEGAALLAGLSQCDGFGSASAEEYVERAAAGAAVTPEAYQACNAGLDAVETFLRRRPQSANGAAPSLGDLEALLAVVGARSWQGQAYWLGQGTNAARDASFGTQWRDWGMSQTLLAQAQASYRGKRIAIWAHNIHIARAYERMDISPYPRARTMGSFLSEALQGEYYALMLTGYRVAVNWPGVASGPLPEITDPDQVEARLHAFGAGDIFVDLHAKGEDLPFDLRSAQPFAHLFGQGVPREQFDGLLYLEDVPMMRPVGVH